MPTPTRVRARRFGAVIAAGLITLMALPVVAGAAPAGLGMLKSYRLPTTTDPHFVAATSDGNVWFTVQHGVAGAVARVTPRGDITEFDVCGSCVPNDIVQGPDGNLYIGENGGQLLQVTTAGQVLNSISPCGAAFCDPLGGVAADSTSIWFADSFNNQVGRFNVFAAPGANPFTFFPAPGVDDVAAAPDGTVWFTGSNSIGEIHPAVGVVSSTPLSAEGARITVAPNGTVWATEIFADLIARLTPVASGPHALVEFPTQVGASPLDIVAAPDGNVWFTQNLRGNIARITQDGVITEASKAIAFTDAKRPDPVGISIATNGNPWYAESLTDKVVNLKLR